MELGLLAQTPGAFRSALEQLGEARFATRPTPDEWSPVEVLKHVWAADHVIAPRIVQVLIRPGVHLPAFDERLLGERLAALRITASDAIDILSARRVELVALLAVTTDAERRHTGVHELKGEMTIDDLFGSLLTHEQEHLNQLDATVALLLSRG